MIMMMRSTTSTTTSILLLVSLVSLFVPSYYYNVYGGTNEEGLKFLYENKQKPDVITLESGLQYKVLNHGTGNYHPVLDSQCLCHYAGTLIDGTTFDSSYDRGEPTSFAPNQVIKGWTEAMQLMVEGDVWELYIPSELAYGDNGSPPKIPGGSVLIFKIEIIKIKHDISFLKPAMKCNITTKDKCTEQEINYITKVQNWDTDKISKEKERLENMDIRKMKEELKVWIQRRINLLREFTKKDINTTTTSTSEEDRTTTSEL